MIASAVRDAAGYLCLGLLAVGLVGCAQGDDSTIDAASPWASEFRDEYNKSTDPFVREVLSDGKVSDQELAEMWDRFVSCMDDAGVAVTNIRPGGGYDFGSDTGTVEESHDADTRCIQTSGQFPIAALYSVVRRNPQNLDENAIMAACLVKKGAVPQGYSPEDFARDNETRSYPYTDKDQGPLIAQECSADPLGLFDGGAE